MQSEAERIYESGGHACLRAEVTMPPLPVAVKSGVSTLQQHLMQQAQDSSRYRKEGF